ncbi:hypothetical protein HN958_00660 [Candidatus Falkowbacteria bacterium]|nr:hypothetical protein [Candidatus Falkowbacteria bacterium]MBT7007001.1 hypothetical protein [Candidatus Falkowbacteria bacterium]
MPDLKVLKITQLPATSGNIVNRDDLRAALQLKDHPHAEDLPVRITTLTHGKNETIMTITVLGPK